MRTAEELKKIRQKMGITDTESMPINVLFEIVVQMTEYLEEMEKPPKVAWVENVEAEQPRLERERIEQQRFQVHASGGHAFHFPSCEKLFSAVGQWVDEIAGEGDTLEIMMFRMTDAQYNDLVNATEGSEG